MHKKAFAAILGSRYRNEGGIGMAFIAMNLGGTELQASLSFTGAASGPLLGMFSLGAFFSWANWIGVSVGGVLGLILPMWMGIGAYSVVGTPSTLEYPLDNCSVLNTTDSITTTLAMNVTNTMPVEISGLSAMFTISYLWYPAIGAATVIVKIKINDYEEDFYINAPVNLTNGRPYMDLDHTPVYGLSVKESNGSLNGIANPVSSEKSTNGHI